MNSNKRSQLRKGSGAVFFNTPTVERCEWVPMIPENTHTYSALLIPFLQLFVLQDSEHPINLGQVVVPDDGEIVAGMLTAARLELVQLQPGRLAKLTAYGVHILKAGLS